MNANMLFTESNEGKKEISYAYASSPLAAFLKCAKTGCYAVIARSIHGAAAFDTWQDAYNFALGLPEDFARFSMPDPSAR